MEEGLINTLNAIGTPVVITAAVAVAYLMRTISQKLSFSSGLIAVISVALYVPIDLYPKARDAFSNTEINIHPNSFIAFTNDMSPINVSIIGKRGETEIASIMVPAVGSDFFENKKILLERNGDADSFYAFIGSNKLGIVEDSELESKGFHRVAPGSKTKTIESSKRVYVGKSWSVSNTPLGKLELTFLRIENGKAVVKLHSSSYGIPQPEIISISNKQFDVHSFEGIYEVAVQVREANFSVAGSEWAAFTIIIT